MADPKDENPELNPGQVDADAKLSNSAADLSDQEKNAPGSGSSEENISEQESESAPPDSFINNVKGKAKERGKKVILNAVAGKGPIIAIGGGVGLVGVLLILIIPAFLLFHLLANLFDTYDPSAPMMTQITKLVVLNKLGANSATTGSCSTVKIACRFKTPSNELLRQLNDKGITAYDADKKPIVIDMNEKWAAKKPAFYSVGEGKNTYIIEAKNIRSALQNNTEFRIAFNKTVNKLGARAFTRFNPAMLNTMERWRLKLRDVISLKSESAKAGENTTSKVFTEGIKIRGADGAAVEGTESIARTIANNVSLRVSKLLTLVGKTGKGSGLVLLMAIQCMANEVPGMLKKSLVDIQKTAIVTAGAPVLTTMAAIEASDVGPKVSGEVLKKWTEQGSNGQTALGAAGTKYGLFGDTDTTTDETYQNVTPAAFGGAIEQLTVADQLYKNPVSNIGCAALMNPISGAAIAAGINVAIAGTSEVTFGVSFLVNLGLGVGITALISAFSQTISDGLSQSITPILSAAAQPAIEKLNQPGQTFGNVIPDALGAISESNGSQAFGAAMTVDQLPEYTKVVQEQEIANAEIDRATLSPFDATSKYTFVGSIVHQFLPYYSSLTSLGGGLSVLGSLLPISLGSIFSSSAHAADSTSKYADACPESEPKTGLNGEKLATDIFCHHVYGVLPQDGLSIDTVMQNMEQLEDQKGNMVNDDTGEAIIDNSVLATVVEGITDTVEVGQTELEDPSYGDWVTTCAQDTETAQQCLADTPVKKTYALYTAAKNALGMVDTRASDLPGGGGTLNNDGNSEEAAFSGFFDDETLALYYADDTGNSIDNSVPTFQDFISSVRDTFDSYKATVVASVSSVTANSLARFSLWR